MTLMSNISLNLYSVLFLLILFIQSQRNDDKSSMEHRLYVSMVITTAFLLGVDIFSRFDGRADTFFSTANHLGNLLMFLLNPVLPSI